MRLHAHVRSFAAAVPLIAFRGVAGGMPILVGLFIGRRWGLIELAAYTVANAAIAVALVITDWGATRALTRNFAILAPDAAAELLGSANGFRLLLVTLLLAVGGGAVLLGRVDAPMVPYLAVLFPLCPLVILTTNAVSERIVAGETAAIGYAVAAGLIVFGALAAAVLVMKRGPHWFVAAYVAGKIVEASILASGRWWVLAVTSHSIGATALALWPFSAQMILGVIYSRAAVFIVQRLMTRFELGLFSVAATLQSSLYLISASTGMMHFPEIARRERAGDARGTREILIRYTAVSVAGVAFGVLLLWILGGPIGAALKVPPSFRPFMIAFAALAILGIFSTMAGFLMQAQGNEALAARLSCVTLALALVYQFVAVSAFGLWGIFVGVAAAELTTIAVFGIALRRPRMKESL